jgi:hypothetical protein
MKLLPIAVLKPLLAAHFYDRESLWTMLLPLLCGVSLLCFLLAGLGWLANWINEAHWRVERSPWEKPDPTLVEKWMKRARKVLSRSSELTVHQTRKTAPKAAATALAVAHVEPSKKPPQAVFSPFGATDGTPKEGFAWSKKKEIL